MRESCKVGRALPLLLPEALDSPARASVARAPGGITLGQVEGELGADFTALGRYKEVNSAPSSTSHSTTMPP